MSANKTSVLINNNTFFHLFSQRTSPTETDRRIQSKLGDFQSLKQLIERDLAHGSPLVGVSSSQIRSSNPIPSSLPPQQVSFNKINVFAKSFQLTFLDFFLIFFGHYRKYLRRYNNSNYRHYRIETIYHHTMVDIRMR